MSDYKNKLEEWIAEKLKPIDKYARPTRGSGAGNEIGDISNALFYVECKIKGTKENIIIDYKNEWKKLLDDLPINTTKTPLIATENKEGERFITLKAEDFFEILYLLYLTND